MNLRLLISNHNSDNALAEKATKENKNERKTKTFNF